jgi:FtsP/CotA-like multicopper oxidase with cupredoxin domain
MNKRVCRAGTSCWLVALAGGSLLLSRSAGAQNSMSMPMHTAATPALNEGGPADVTLRISPVLVDVNNDKTISTIGYNGQVPGPLIRMREGKPISVKVFNDTDTPEFVHWHGQFISSEVDGAGEEKSMVIPPHGQLRYQFTPRPAGFRWNYLLFDDLKPVAQPDQVIPMEIGKINGGKGGFNIWTINGQPFDKSEPIKIQQARRYRLAFVNKSDDMHPLHLHRHNFEITKIHGIRP